MSYDPPLEITIPVPSEIPRARGAYSTSHYGGNLRTRCSNHEYDLIKNEADILGVSMSSFVRWSAVYAAKALQRHREEASKDNTAVILKE